MREWQSALEINRIKLREWKDETIPGVKAASQSDTPVSRTLLLQRQAIMTLTIEMRHGEVVGAYWY